MSNIFIIELCMLVFHIQALGVNEMKKMTLKRQRSQMDSEDECDICRASLYTSWITCQDDSIYCLQHAIKYLTNNRIQASQCKLMYVYGKEEMEDLIERVRERYSEQLKKKKQN